jgi:hypothetical protein
MAEQVSDWLPGAGGLTDAHGKSLRQDTAKKPLFVAWYNFACKNQSLKGNTPATASGLIDHVWTIKELVERAAA